MPNKDIRITRPHTFVDEIIKFCGKSKYVIGCEIGSKTQKEHFHVYLEIDSKRAHNWSRELEQWREKFELKGNTDFACMKRGPKDYLYCCKGDDSQEVPKVYSNFLTDEQILSSQKLYWTLRSEKVETEKVETEKVETEKVDVDSDKDNIIKVLRLKLEIEREKTKRKSTVKFTTKVKPFEEYITEEFEKYVEVNEITFWNGDEVSKLDEFVLSKFSARNIPKFFDRRPLRQYRNYLLYKVDKKLAMQYIYNDV